MHEIGLKIGFFGQNLLGPFQGDQMTPSLLLWDSRSAHNRGPNEPNRSHFQSFFIVEKFSFFSPFFPDFETEEN